MRMRWRGTPQARTMAAGGYRCTVAFADPREMTMNTLTFVSCSWALEGTPQDRPTAQRQLQRVCTEP
jgi:hypothetical protein